MITNSASLSVHARDFARPRRRVELTNACNGLNDQSRNESHQRTVNRERDGELVACHSETRPFPELVESRFSSTFVAQVLGQDSSAKRMDPGVRARAYARTRAERTAPQLLRLA